MAANLGEDADTTAAITGQLHGPLYGASGIPEIWISRVVWAEQIRVKAATLVGNTPPPSSFSSAITLSTSPISKLRAANDERRQFRPRVSTPSSRAVLRR